jgi:hypothetical protein
MNWMVIIPILGALAGCQRPLPPDGFVQTDGIVPLTVEQALPDNIPAFNVLQRDGCYYYPSFGRLILIETMAAPDATIQCNA